MAISYARQVTFSAFLLQDILDPNHWLVKLASVIDWEAIHERLSPYYSMVGRQGLPIRLMVGLHLLKHREGMSDEQVAERIRGDLYWMYFCGVDADSLSAVYSHLDSSSMTRFRRRIGDKGWALVEAVIREYLIEKRLVDTSVMTTDSSCLEKHVDYPTDSGLLDRGRKNLLRGMNRLKDLGVKSVQGVRSFVRCSKKIVLFIAKLGKGRQERIRKGTLELAKMASHVVRRSQKMLKHYKQATKKGVLSKARQAQKAAQYLASQVGLVLHVIKQARERYRGRHLKKKIYSLHEPDVVCIRKGKRSRPNEYGMKFNLSVDKHGFIVAHEDQWTNVHDAKLLEPALKHWEQVTGKLPDQVNGDRGYVQLRGSESRRVRKVQRLCIPSKGRKAHPDHDKSWFRRGQRLRAQIEGVIGHVKSRGRCRYKGRSGSRTHLTLNCVTWNLRKLGKVTRL
jgi:IS5 family transposase